MLQHESQSYQQPTQTMTEDVDDETERMIPLPINPSRMTEIGLRVFYNKQKVRKSSKDTNVKRFLKCYGADPFTVCSIWEDFQLIEDEDIHVPQQFLNPRCFLMSLHFLMRYPTEHEKEIIWKRTPKTTREWIWYFLKRIQSLKKYKIRMPDDWGSDIWVMTVDGTHCWISEPNHPEWSQDRQYYSHKFAKAGINYELGISISSNRLVWMNAPYKAGSNDASIFRDRGMRDYYYRSGKKQ
jgi:hypothetical protein